MDVLDLFDDAAKAAAFDSYWNKLQDSSHAHTDLETLRVCIRLLPPAAKDETAHGKLQDFIIHSIAMGPDDPQRLYNLAELSSINPSLGGRIFDKIHQSLSWIHSAPEHLLEDFDLDERLRTSREGASVAVSCLDFLKCSFWLPLNHSHHVTPALVQTLVNLLGRELLDDASHDALSALLSQLNVPMAIAHGRSEEIAPLDTRLSQSEFRQGLVEQQLWIRLGQLPSAYFTSSSSKVFKTWFQWLGFANANDIALEAVYDPVYWSRLQAGLLNGFGEQRKYCLGILRHSLLVARHNINTPLMTLAFGQRFAYQAQYDKYCTLFEIMVLDRYQNQIQACLPELTTLLGPESLISSAWQTTLLSAALTAKVQDGIRKLIGTWYMNYVIKDHGSIAGHTDFFIEGFLPWATQGSLFTSSLLSSRQVMTCGHGAHLVNLLSVFIVSLPMAVDRRKLFSGVLQFVLDKGGRIFQYTIVYILEGLLEGFRKSSSFKDLGNTDLKVLLRVSRLPGLPEIATDLCITYCAEICEATFSESACQEVPPGYDELRARFKTLQTSKTYGSNQGNQQSTSQTEDSNLSTLQQFLQRLRHTQHKSIQNDTFVSACAGIVAILEKVGPEEDSQHNDLCDVLEALWDEAERQEFRRPIVVQIPPLFFHRACIQICLEYSKNYSDSDGTHPLRNVLTKAMEHLQKLAERRSYLASVLTASLRTACLSNSEILTVLPFEDFLVRFFENPPIAKTEFLFEVAAAQKLQQYLPHRGFTSYYGKREWRAYAAAIDVLNHLPDNKVHIAENVMQRLLEPWATQKPPIPIISKWKSSLQLQAMLLLTESCINFSNAQVYLEFFTNALMVESWPRYRYLLEWIVARIYSKYPNHAPRLLDTLTKLDEGSPIRVASLTKLAILIAPVLDSEEFALDLMTQLVPFSSHNKVQIRHEAHWSIPIVWDLAVERGWERLTSNPAFKALNAFVTGLERFSLPPSSIRTLKLDAIADYTVTDIFEGNYLAIGTPEPELFSHTDILELWAEDQETGLRFPTGHVPLGNPKPGLVVQMLDPLPLITNTNDPLEIVSTAFQTKSGFDLSSLVPITGPPCTKSARPASIILVASLIDNPTNLGGLSRISESFGLEALYMADIRQTAHKDFKATSVTSEKHLKIKELKVGDVARRLTEWKSKGWTVVGVEQTDRSGILGTPDIPTDPINPDDDVGVKLQSKKKNNGTLPRKCILVLGSEKGGISSEVLAVVDRCVEIKTTGVTRSLNVQTAGGIAVYEWWREWGGKL